MQRENWLTLHRKIVTVYALPVIYSDTINPRFAHAMYEVLKLLEQTLQNKEIILGLFSS